jgi:hypothetical protein
MTLAPLPERLHLLIQIAGQQTASASVDMSALMNVVSIERSRSGAADSSRSCRNRAGSILLGAVIVMSSSEAL